MNAEQLLDAMGALDEDLVLQTERLREKKKRPAWLKWGAFAACLCLIAVGVLALRENTALRATPALQHWVEGYSAADYFKNNEHLGIESMAQASVAADSLPWTEQRDFSDDRTSQEAKNVIPPMPDYPLYYCTAYYRADGSFYGVKLFWQRHGDRYSGLTVTAGTEAFPSFEDCVYVLLDENGSVIEGETATVTERDGVLITAEGREGLAGISLTYQTENGWYQISGSWNDSYEDVAALLDWFWERPLDFDLFAMENGVNYTYTTLAEMPGAFSDAMPDFPAFGYLLGENYLELKNGEPYRFEGYFYSGLDQAEIDAYLMYEKTGWTEVHWCVFTEPDVYMLEDCLGDISDLTEAKIAETLSQKSWFSFMRDGLLIWVYCRDAAEVWPLVQSMQ